MIVNKDLLYVPITSDVLVYSISKLLDLNQSVQPEWTVPGLDTLDVDKASGTLLLTSRDYTQQNPSSYLRAFGPDGKLLWSKTLATKTQPPAPAASVAVDNGRVFVILDIGAELTAYDLSGNLIWKDKPFVCPNGGTNLFLDVIAKDGIAMAISLGDKCVAAWDAQTGQRKWVLDSPIPLSFVNRPLILNGVVYTSNTYTWALDQETGKVLGVSGKIPQAQNRTGTPIYDSERKQVLVWGQGLWAFKPLR